MLAAKRFLPLLVTMYLLQMNSLGVLSLAISVRVVGWLFLHGKILLKMLCKNGVISAELEDLFTEDELQDNAEVVRLLNEEFNQIHRLDGLDVAIAIGAGLLSTAVDILLVGIPRKTSEGMKAGPLSNYIRDHIENSLTSEQVKQLEIASKVPYDAPVNKGFTKKGSRGSTLACIAFTHWGTTRCSAWWWVFPIS